MAQSAPQYSLWKIIDRLKAVIMSLFWAIFLLSILPLILNRWVPNLNLDDLINILNILILSLFFILDTTSDYILTPIADGKRRDDFIDNSFGSSFTPNPSIGYFDNDNIAPGIYKAACNLFENCFFTYSLVKAVTLKKILIPAVIMLLVGASTWFGFKQVPFALSLLQVLFSAKLLGTVIKQSILLIRLDHIQDGLISLFQHQDFSSNSLNYDKVFYRLWLKYESLHSTIPAEIPEKIFIKMNPGLTADWVNLKARYNIH